MAKLQQIRGAGGGGKDGSGSGRTPIESPDSLRSRQYARVLDLVSEGEIVGLVDGLKSVYLDNTPIENADGSFNFAGVIMASRTGTQSQDYIAGFGAVESEAAVSVAVEYATPVVRSIANPNANAIRVTLSVPTLSLQNSTNGDLGGTSVDIAIDLQTAGGGYVEQIADTISGKTTSKYQRAYRIQLTGSGPWDLRVRRLTVDSTSSTLQNATYWDSYTEIIDAKLRYPNSAMVGLSIDAERFNAIPTRGFEILGMKIRVPSNYDPETRAYTGAWDGTFTTAWTNNPAWCFYDLLTNERYGLGSYISTAQVDKWALYEIAQHCDELVPDGYGGMEPRFTCSLYLQSREEAYKVINDMAAIFCGIAYWGAGTIIAVQDAPADPVALFTPANVVDGAFNYSGSSVKQRHTVALVSWNDPADRYKQKIEYVEDQEGIALFGIVQTEVVALGCTSRGQAHRYGRRILYTERMETETVSFKAGLDGLAVAPGEVIQTSDPVRAGVRLGGRLLAATDTEVTLDADVELDPAATYTLWAVLPDGTVQSRAVTTSASTTATLQVSPAFDTAPQALAMWVLAASNLAPETWRVISIAEADGTNAEITALKYSPNKYAEIEQGVILEALPTSALSATQSAPAGFVISEELYLVTPSVVGARITASWAGNAPRYELQYRIAGGNWATAYTNTPSVDIQPVEAGNYEFQLTAISTLGRPSIPVSVTKEIYGKTAAPLPVDGFVITKVGGVAIAVWALVADLDVRIGGRIVIRHSPMVTGATWQDGVVLEEFAGDAVTGLLPLITGTYMIKAKDSSRIYSLTSSSFIATEGMVTGFNTVATSTQAPGFIGAKDGVSVIDEALRIDGTLLISEMTGLISTWPRISSLGGIRSAGVYEFDDVMDLGTVETRRFEADLSCLSVDTGDLISFRGLISEWDSISGAVVNDCDATLFASTTDDDPSGSPIWSEWTPYFVGDFTCRAIKHKLLLNSGSTTHNIQISNLTVHAKVPV
jgi:predicted phage tail protein